MSADLVREHYALVYRFAYRLSGSATDAEDIAQQTFLTAHRKRNQLRDDRSAAGWLCAIARNIYLKSRQRHRSTLPLESVSEPHASMPEVTVVDSQELQQALNELPEEFRTPLILFYFQEFSYREIAEILQVPQGTVMSRLSRGKVHLRTRLSVRETQMETVAEPAPRCPAPELAFP